MGTLGAVVVATHSSFSMPAIPSFNRIFQAFKWSSCCLSACLSLASLVAVVPTALANTTAEEFTVEPIYNINHQEAGGYTGTTGVNILYPLFQTPGQNLGFVVGTLNVNNTGNLGGGLQTGYRNRLSEDTIWGVYGGLDVQSTNLSTFTQAGFGSELFGNHWDVHLSGNIPLGNTRRVVTTGGQSATNPRFQNNQLIVDQNFVQRIESALTTLSLEAGVQLADFGEGSVLWGRGGLYYLGRDSASDSLGLRLSLDQRLQNNIRLGTGIQHDDIFGTNVLFSANILVGAPDQRPVNAAQNQSSRLWSRAAEPLARTNTILIEEQVTTSRSQTGVAAINPATGRPYTFRHVDPATGTATAAGTVEEPRNTIANAVGISTANSDNIIYVQPGDAGGAFTLPDGVEVRSVGPLQQLATQFGSVTLPGSGSGTLPTVSGTARLGNNSLLSGFAINPGGANGIVANGTNVTIEDNTITNANRGIRLPNIDGAVNIARNQISNTTNEGILFRNIDGNDNTTINVNNNTLTALGDRGIEFALIEGNATANIALTNNQINNAQNDGIFFNDIQGDAVATVDISNNTINGGNVTLDGIELNGTDEQARLTLTVNNNQISNITEDGIQIDGFTGTSVANVTVATNQINDSRDGIRFFMSEGDANATIAVIGNTITTSRDGIFFDDLLNNVTANIVVQGNTITGSATSQEGIFFDDISSMVTATLSVNNNTITNVGREGIEIDPIRGNATATATVNNNIITNAGSDGINIDHRSANNFCLTLDSNSVTMPAGDGIELVSGGTGQFQVINLGTLAARNTGALRLSPTPGNFINGTAGTAPCP